MKTKTVQPARGTAVGRIEPAKVAQSSASGATVAVKEAKKPFNPVKFFTEVRQEGRKITWPSRKETWITTVMVLIMVILAGVFFYVVDGALGYLASFLTKLGQ